MVNVQESRFPQPITILMLLIPSYYAMLRSDRQLQYPLEHLSPFLTLSLGGPRAIARSEGGESSLLI